MANRAKPWEENWATVKELGSGAQGSTFLVRNNQEDTLAVAKRLHRSRASDPKARARMASEVVNLDLVAQAGGKVPQVIENATGNYKDLDKPIYFLMEFIEGQSLKNLISTEGKLEPEQAIELSVGLCETVHIGHQQNVMHRDIKPDNIIVSSNAPLEVWIVDYGISFNDQGPEADEDRTHENEGVGNSFSDLPERHTPGFKRLPESDIAAICGVLFYCLSGEFPKPLRDLSDLPPHRQPHRKFTEILRGHEATSKIVGILDQGFQRNPRDRFSSVHELQNRLVGTSEMPTGQIVNLRESLISESEKLVGGTREILLGSLREKMNQYFAEIANEILAGGSHFGEYILEYVSYDELSRFGARAEYIFPGNFEEVHPGYIYQIATKRVPKARFLIVNAAICDRELAVCGAKGSEGRPFFGGPMTLHQLSNSAPAVVGGLGSASERIAPSQPSSTPTISFGGVERWFSTDREFLVEKNDLVQKISAELTQAASDLRIELQD